MKQIKKKQNEKKQNKKGNKEKTVLIKSCDELEYKGPTLLFNLVSALFELFE